jgi:hypothetical protein
MSEKNTNDTEIKLPVEKLPSGMYIITVNNGKQSR